jgi:HK97 family phage prohead protease
MSSENEALSYEERFEAYENELRDKYTQKQRDEMAKSGEAMPDGSYPIADSTDLDNAISTSGLGSASDTAIRKHIIARAKALGLESKIPDAWAADGTKKEAKADDPDVEDRAKCPTCKGEGTILGGNRDCPDCDGSGTVDGDSAPDGSRAEKQRVNYRRKERQRKVPLCPELRHFTAEGIEVREQSDTNSLILTGKPIIYDVEYPVTDIYGTFMERMAPTVMDKVLERGVDCRLLLNHTGLALARTTSGTLSLSNGPDALSFSATLDARQQLANDLAIAIERRDLTSMSIGFSCGQDVWSDDFQEREVQSFSDLVDISAVTYPASPTTSIDVARRMAMEIPIESGARARKMYVDSRAGKKMSASNANLVLEALHNLHSALGEAGAAVLPEVSPMDPDGSVGQDGDAGNGETNADALTPVDGTESTVEPVGSDGPGEPQYMDDGSQGALSGSEGYPGFADGSGLRGSGQGGMPVPATAEERADCQESWSLFPAPGEDIWIHSEHFEPGDPTRTVVYETFGDDPGFYRRSFTRGPGPDYEVTFTSEPERVLIRTEFVPVVPVEPVVAERVSVRSSNALRLALEARKRRR